jgi:hypothetical protein
MFKILYFYINIWHSSLYVSTFLQIPIGAEMPTGHTTSSQLVTVITSRCLVAASTADGLLFLGSQTVPSLSYQIPKVTTYNI